MATKNGGFNSAHSLLRTAICIGGAVVLAVAALLTDRSSDSTVTTTSVLPASLSAGDGMGSVRVLVVASVVGLIVAQLWVISRLKSQRQPLLVSTDRR